jgi:hypothetical protein
VLWCRADIVFQILPKNHPTNPGHFVLTYLESRTKNNQGGYRSATRPRNREDPKVVADPNTMCPETHLIARFLEYKSKVPPNPICQKLMLQPNSNHKVSCFFFNCIASGGGFLCLFLGALASGKLVRVIVRTLWGAAPLLQINGSMCIQSVVSTHSFTLPTFTCLPSAYVNT